MTTTTIDRADRLGRLGKLVARTLGLGAAMDAATREAEELTERWDVPQGDHVPEDLRDTQPRYWLTRSGQQIAGRLDVNDLAEGSQSPAAPILLALFPVLAALALLLSSVAPWLAVVPLAGVVVLAVLAWQATNSLLWPALAIATGVVMPLAGPATGGFGMAMRNPLDFLVLLAIGAAVLVLGGFLADRWRTGVRNTMLGVAAGVVTHTVASFLPPSLAAAAWFAVGCSIPLFYAHALAKARALSLLVDAHTHMSEVLAGHATAHVGARQEQADAAARDPSPLLRLGVATGLFGSLRDPYAPDAGLPFGLSAGRDLSTHMICFGSTGTGKTSGVIRPTLRQWLQTVMGGTVVMDGKGGLAGELRDLAGYLLLEPGRADVALLEGLTPRDALLALASTSADNSSRSNDQFFTASGREMLRHGLVLLDAVVRYERSQVEIEAQRAWRWTLHDLHEMLVRLQRQHDDTDAKARELLLYALNLPEYERGGLLTDAVAYFSALPTGDDKTRQSIWATVQTWIAPIMSDERLLSWAKLEHGEDITIALRGGAVGVCLPAFSYGEAGKAITRLLKQRLFCELRRRADRDGVAGRPHWRDNGETPVLFVVDEAQEVVTDGDLEMLPVARSLGAACCYATQNVDSFFVRFGQHGATKLLDSFRSVVSYASSEATEKWVRERLGHIRALTFPTRSAAIGFAESAAAAAASPLFDASHPGAPLFRKLRRDGAGAIRNARNRGAEGLAGGHAGWRSSTAHDSASALLLPRVEGGVWQSRPLIDDATWAAVTAQPFTAVAQVMRGGVPRRDVVKLMPDFG